MGGAGIKAREPSALPSTAVGASAHFKGSVMTRRKLVVGNWKMHGTAADIGEIEAIAAAAASVPGVDTALCLPSTLIERAARAVPAFPIGAQDIHFAEKGAHTGCISAAMLHDSGAKLTLVGHSERRDAQRESDSEIRSKAEAALASGLEVILCVGESLDVREAGDAISIVERQLENSLPASLAAGASLSIAYEPIWAIGTGKVPSIDNIDAMHGALRGRIGVIYGDAADGIRLLYGGSVKPSNAADIFAVEDVDGALVGGASLKAADFLPIVEAAAASM
jgi:triosephosphate isomerase